MTMKLSVRQVSALPWAIPWRSLKAVADYVADDIDRDGVWKACRHLGLI